MYDLHGMERYQNARHVRRLSAEAGDFRRWTPVALL